MDVLIRRAAATINNASAIVVTAGAGIGVDSGLPDFRGSEGLWKAYPPLKQRGLSLPEMSTPHWFETDPKFAWGFFGHRLMLYRDTVPHEGFHILQKWCADRKKGHFVFTSNVDNQFQVAGFDEDKIVECHGSLSYFQTTTGKGDIWSVPKDWNIDIDNITFCAKSTLPKGPPDLPDKSQKLLRPNVLMFGDDYWIPDRTYAQIERYSLWKRNIERNDSIVVIEIGAGLAVPTVRCESEDIVCGDVGNNERNNCLIRINPRDPSVPRLNDISLPMPALKALQQIDSYLSLLDK